MDRAEYRELMSQIRTYDAQGSYSDAADLIEEINWKRVKSASTLCSVAGILGRAGRFDEEKELLLMAYDRASIGRSILYELTGNALRAGDISEAKKYYNEYIETAPKDSKRYVLQYRIGQAEGKSAEELIPCLEELHERAFSEEWGYELASLYDVCGMEDKCVQICDEIAIYFGEGEYVDKALELKEKYKELNAQQRRKRLTYHISQAFADGLGETQAEAAQADGKFDTKDLQKELAASLQQLKEAEDTASVEQTMHSVRKLVDGSDLQIEAPKAPEESAAGDALGVLTEEADGQMGLNLGLTEQEEDSDQVGGQLRIEDILAEWEKTRAAAQTALEEAEKNRFASAKASAVEQTQSIMDQIEGRSHTDEVPTEETPIPVVVQSAVPEEEIPQPAQAADDSRKVVTAAPQAKKPAQTADDAPLRLTEEQKAQFTYFMSIEGMDRQISDALEALRANRSAVNSATGNVLIIGEKGCGKTMMASKLVKTAQKMFPRAGARVGKINAGSLNEKDVATVLGKVRGGYLILEEAGKLSIAKAQELSDLMDLDTGGLVVVIEGTSDEIMGLRHNGTDLAGKFPVRIEIPMMSSDELVAFAQHYAAEKNASLDDMAVLALYTKISAISKANHATSLDEVKEIMDKAIQKAVKKNLSNTMRSIFSSRYDEENHVILVEKDFD